MPTRSEKQTDASRRSGALSGGYRPRPTPSQPVARKTGSSHRYDRFPTVVEWRPRRLLLHLQIDDDRAHPASTRTVETGHPIYQQKKLHIEPSNSFIHMESKPGRNPSETQFITLGPKEF